MRKIYLASRYGRKDELREYRSKLESMGHDVTSRWLDQSADCVRGSDVDLEVAKTRASEDLLDIADSDLVICFTEPPDSPASRGGRHVEMGYAIGIMKQVMVVGHRENVFCCLQRVRFFSTWEECLCVL